MFLSFISGGELLFTKDGGNLKFVPIDRILSGLIGLRIFTLCKAMLNLSKLFLSVKWKKVPHSSSPSPGHGLQP